MSKERSESILRRLSRRGKQDASLILDLREACRRTLEATDGIDLVLGLDPDADDVLNSVMDSAYDDFLPILLKRSGGVAGLYWHTDPRMLLESAASFYKWLRGEYPAELSIHEIWKSALQDATSFTMEEHEIAIKYVSTDPAGNTLAADITKMAVFTPMDYQRTAESEKEA